MKVLFCIRNDYHRNFAGDSMQLIKMSDYLKSKGVDVTINTGHITDYSTYDIIHLFNITRMGETYNYYKIAKRYKKTIVLSPIYWDLEKYYKSIKDYKSLKIWDKCKKFRKEILDHCEIIYPNSKLEGELIKKQFGEEIKYKVIYNGIDEKLNIDKEYDFKKIYGLDDYVLCVGRVCRRKNQLKLAKACNELGYNLVLIGNVNDKKYFKKCTEFKNVKYLGFMSIYHIYNAYKQAKVHVLPSYVETPGLTSLEAASVGCKVVTTIEGTAKEYFQDKAYYCDPYSYLNVKKSLEKSLCEDRNEDISNYIKENFNWNKCLENLYISYINILGTNLTSIK